MENFEGKEKASDAESVLILIKHIENPCENLQGNNIRAFYIGEAKRILDTIRDPEMKKLLEEVIEKYTE